jgi:hypothetical protein
MKVSHISSGIGLALWSLPLIFLLCLQCSGVYAQGLGEPGGTCSDSIPCYQGYCSKDNAYGFTPEHYSNGYKHNCNATAECGQYAAPANFDCPINVCCRWVTLSQGPLVQTGNWKMISWHCTSQSFVFVVLTLVLAVASDSAVLRLSSAAKAVSRTPKVMVVVSQSKLLSIWSITNYIYWMPLQSTHLSGEYRCHGLRPTHRILRVIQH